MILAKSVGVIRILVEVLNLIVVIVEDSQSVPVLIRVILFLAILLLPGKVTLDDFIRKSRKTNRSLLFVHHVDCTS